MEKVWTGVVVTGRTVDVNITRLRKNWGPTRIASPTNKVLDIISMINSDNDMATMFRTKTGLHIA